MLCEYSCHGLDTRPLGVLILVLMEDALRDLNDYFLKVRDLS